MSQVRLMFTFAIRMKKKRFYSVFQLATAVVMIISLLWLTVNTPFATVVGAGFCFQGQSSNNNVPANESDDNNPFGNTTEEKVPASSNLSEEYLHHHETIQAFTSEALEYNKIKNSDTYIAFHGETLVPPPNFS